MSRCLQLSREQKMSYDKRLDLTPSQQRALAANHVTHGLPVYNSSRQAYLLYHSNFVSAYSELLKQPLWTAANLSSLRHAVGFKHVIQMFCVLS